MNAIMRKVSLFLISLAPLLCTAGSIPAQNGTPIICDQSTFEYTYSTALDGIDPTPELAGDIGFIQEANGTSFFTDATLYGDTARVTYMLSAGMGLQFDDLVVRSRADVYNGEGLVTGHYRVDGGGWQLFFTTHRFYQENLEESYTNQNIGGQAIDIRYTITHDRTSPWTDEVAVQLFRSNVFTSYLFSITGTMVPDGSDNDSDGMADGWEHLYFGGDTSATNNPDRDGHDNLREYIAGTDPTNSDSCFMVTNAWNDAAGYVVQWGPCVSDRWYRVGWSSNLVSGFTSLVDHIVFPQNSWTNTHNAEDKGFFSVGVQMVP